MKKIIRHVLPLIIYSAGISVGTTFADPAVTVLFPNDAAPSADSLSQTWFALCTDGAPALKKVSVIAKMQDGKKVLAADGCKNSIALLRGASWLKDREVTSFTGDKQEASAKITGNGTETNIWVTAEEPNGPYLNVERGGINQYFWTQPKAQWDQWELVWTGDLDGDGAPDFITRAWSEEESDVHNAHAIFLSSLAAEGELYGVIGRPFEKPSK